MTPLFKLKGNDHDGDDHDESIVVDDDDDDDDDDCNDADVIEEGDAFDDLFINHYIHVYTLMYTYI